MSAAPATTRAPRSAPVKASSESDVCVMVSPRAARVAGHVATSRQISELFTRGVADENVNGVGLRRTCNAGHGER